MTEEEAARTEDETPTEADDDPAEERTDASESPDAAESDDVLGSAGTNLVARIAVEDESLAADVEEHVVDLESERRELEAEVDDLRARLKRKQADFQNYKKRAKKRQERLEERATEDLVERLVGVRDNLKRAAEEEYEDVESLREGVELTLKELDRVFDEEGVSEISPDPGSEVDPQRHEVMLRVDSDEPEDTIAEVFQPGYEMGEKVLRSAQVTVSDGPGDEDDSGE